MKQLSLPGVRTEPTSADIKAEVQRRMEGFELRLAERKKKRARRNAQRRRWA